MRWLAPLIVVLAIVQSASTFAAAGVVNQVMCCCPDIESCKCHEHDQPTAPIQVNRCGGAVDVDAPLLTAMILPPAPAPTTTAHHVTIVDHALPEPTSDLARVPEKPPF